MPEQRRELFLHRFRCQRVIVKQRCAVARLSAPGKPLLGCVEDHSSKKFVRNVASYAVFAEIAESLCNRPAVDRSVNAQGVQSRRVVLRVESDQDFQEHRSPKQPCVLVEHLLDIHGKGIWCQPGSVSQRDSGIPVRGIGVEPVHRPDHFLASSTEPRPQASPFGHAMSALLVSGALSIHIGSFTPRALGDDLLSPSAEIRNPPTGRTVGAPDTVVLVERQSGDLKLHCFDSNRRPSEIARKPPASHRQAGHLLEQTDTHEGAIRADVCAPSFTQADEPLVLAPDLNSMHE